VSYIIHGSSWIKNRPISLAGPSSVKVSLLLRSSPGGPGPQQANDWWKKSCQWLGKNPAKQLRNHHGFAWIDDLQFYPHVCWYIHIIVGELLVCCWFGDPQKESVSTIFHHDISSQCQADPTAHTSSSIHIICLATFEQYRKFKHVYNQTIIRHVQWRTWI